MGCTSSKGGGAAVAGQLDVPELPKEPSTLLNGTPKNDRKASGGKRVVISDDPASYRDFVVDSSVSEDWEDVSFKRSTGRKPTPAPMEFRVSQDSDGQAGAANRVVISDDPASVRNFVVQASESQEDLDMDFCFKRSCDRKRTPAPAEFLSAARQSSDGKVAFAASGSDCNGSDADDDDASASPRARRVSARRGTPWVKSSDAGVAGVLFDDGDASVEEDTEPLEARRVSTRKATPWEPPDATQVDAEEMHVSFSDPMEANAAPRRIDRKATPWAPHGGDAQLAAALQAAEAGSDDDAAEALAEVAAARSQQAAAWFFTCCAAPPPSAVAPATELRFEG